MSAIPMNEFDYEIIDIGSTFTKLCVFSERKLMASAQSPTTLDNIYRGVESARSMIDEKLEIDSYSGRNTLMSSSAAGGLRMVAMGYMAKVTAKAAKEVAMNSGAKILEIISDENDEDERIQILREVSPDIVLLAGGTDFGNKSSIIRNAEIIVKSGIKSTVIIAGNIDAQIEVAGILRDADIKFIRVDNIMPTIHELNLHEARTAIHEEFINQITAAQGIEKLESELDSKKVIPTPGAVLLAAETLAKGTYKKDGIGDLIVIDLGGATTDIHSILPHLREMESEEIGLIVNNEKYMSYRTVEGNLGLRVSARSLVQSAHPQTISERFSPEEDISEAIKAYAEYLEENPEHIAETEQHKQFDRWLATMAIEIALKQHAGYVTTEYDPVMGIVPGMPVGRDLRNVKNIICVGGWFRYQDYQVLSEIIRDILANPGISLLPQGEVNLYVDDSYLMYACGVISEDNPSYAFDLMKKYIIKDN